MKNIPTAAFLCGRMSRMICISIVALLAVQTGNPFSVKAHPPALPGNNGTVESDLDTLIKWMIGDFDNANQHQRDSVIPLTHLSIVRPDTTKFPGKWLDVVITAPGKSAPVPVRQVLQIRRLEEGMIELAPFSVDENGNPNQKLIGCEWYIQYSGSSFLGGTHGYACTVVPGTAYSTTEVEIRNFGAKIWIRGFDNQHLQVTGSDRAPYLFERISKNQELESR